MRNAPTAPELLRLTEASRVTGPPPAPGSTPAAAAGHGDSPAFFTEWQLDGCGSSPAG